MLWLKVSVNIVTKQSYRNQAVYVHNSTQSHPVGVGDITS